MQMLFVMATILFAVLVALDGFVLRGLAVFVGAQMVWIGVYQGR